MIISKVYDMPQKCKRIESGGDVMFSWARKTDEAKYFAAIDDEMR